ncbi:MAG: apolipoprotein N-acyltransferase [Parachlamydiales bacterium]|jgi:apolipoprotein N-acyltransferase
MMKRSFARLLKKPFWPAFGYFTFSWFLSALGKPVAYGFLAPLSAALGLALFWKSLQFVQSKKRAFGLALVWFSLVSAFELSWMTSTEWVGPLILLVYVFLVLALGLEFALLCYFFLFFPSRGLSSWRRILALAGLWTLLEWSRLFFFSGFPFNVLGSALCYSRYSMQMAAFFGVYGLSFWVVLTNAYGYRALFLKTRTKEVLIWLALVLFPYFLGYLHESYQKNPGLLPAGELSVLLIQTALSPAQKEPVFERYREFIPPAEQWKRILLAVKEALLQKTSAGKPAVSAFRKKVKLPQPLPAVDLVVLPEAALPFPAFESFYDLGSFFQVWEQVFGLDEEKAFLPPLGQPLAEPLGKKKQYGCLWKVSNAFWAQALANYLGAEVVIGLDEKEDLVNYNAAFHFQPFSLEIRRYAKRVLVPVVEYFPFEWCAKLAAAYGISGFFTPGKEAKVFPGKVPLGVCICYEEAYGHLMRQNRAQGARLLVNLSNDVWFPASSLPKAHFELGKIRSVENGLPLVRACNTGVTGAVDAFGRVLVCLKDGESQEHLQALFVKVPLDHYQTFYVRWGDLPIVVASLVLLGFFLISKKELPRKRPPT